MPKVRPWFALGALALTVFASADEAADIRAALRQAKTVAEARAVMEAHREYLGTKLASVAGAELSEPAGDETVSRSDREALEGIVVAAQASHRADTSTVSDSKAIVADALRQEQFRDPGKTTAKNWAAHGLDKLWDEIGKFLRRLMPERGEIPKVAGPNLGFLVPVVWFFFSAAVLAFLAWAVTALVRGRYGRTQKSGALLEDDEPERTADEWLQRADELEREGEYRLAVRCLYVAALIRLDEAGVSRFRRWETNWEHLHRIESSPKRPADFSFLAPTQKFDLVWYGNQVKGGEDVAAFRDWYRETMRAVGRPLR